MKNGLDCGNSTHAEFQSSAERNQMDDGNQAHVQSTMGTEASAPAELRNERVQAELSQISGQAEDLHTNERPDFDSRAARPYAIARRIAKRKQLRSKAGLPHALAGRIANRTDQNAPDEIENLQQQVEERRKKIEAELAATYKQMEDNEKENKRMERRIEALEAIFQAKSAEKVDKEESLNLLRSLTASGLGLEEQDWNSGHESTKTQ